MEELKLIMQTLMGLGETAKEGFIWYLVITKLIPALEWGAGIGSLIWVGWYGLRRMFDHQDRRNLQEQEAEWAIRSVRVIRGILGVYNYPAAQQDNMYLSEVDYKDTVEAVRAVKNAAARKED